MSQEPGERFHAKPKGCIRHAAQALIEVLGVSAGAKRAKVTPTTLHRAASKPWTVRAPTRRRIREAANAVAAAMRRQRDQQQANAGADSQCRRCGQLERLGAAPVLRHCVHCLAGLDARGVVVDAARRHARHG